MRFPRFAIALAGAVSVTAGCVSFAPPGFIRNGRHATYRGWVDVNTLGQPAAFLEERDRLPPSEERVRHYRWMYGEGPENAQSH